jgi:Conserved TM helix
METPFAVDLTTSLQQGLDSFFKFIPNLIGFLVILIVGYFVAKLVKSVVAKRLVLIATCARARPASTSSGSVRGLAHRS